MKHRAPASELEISSKFTTMFNESREEEKICGMKHSSDNTYLNSGHKRLKLTHFEISSACTSPTSSDYAEISPVIQSVTKFNGSLHHFKMYKTLDNQDVAYRKNNWRLLKEPIHALKLQVFAKIGMSNDVVASANIFPNDNIENELWVEKHRPQTFVDLLSDEGINRTLLRWLKLWDKIVFSNEKELKCRTGIGKKLQNKPLLSLNENYDEYGRPTQKIVLLCGPPGLGKTTLANVIVQSAGYNAVELNASDDRSPEVFRSVIESSTQMKAVFTEANQPNCLIIDEIDGAPAPSINILVSFIKSCGPTKGKKKKGDIPLLRRPIICICNDQYVPALKPLRQLAFILNFPPTSKFRLVSRLMQVALIEGLESDSSSLMLLCEKVDNDIRACLSIMQFLYNYKREFHISNVKELTIGIKDLRKNLFSVWQDIFHAPMAKLNTKVLNSIQGFGDYNKIFIGMFENYIKIKSKKSGIENVYKGSDWLCFGDIIQNEIYHSQVFSLLSYLPYVGVAFHVHFASVSFSKLSYPSSYYESFTRKTKLQNLLASVRHEITTSLKIFFSSSCLIMDMLPMMIEVIKPCLRPVNTHLFSKQEKDELKRVIDVMIAFNLSYIQERTIEGSYRYVLEPNIAEIVHFSDEKQKKELGYGTKRLIAREVELEKMRKTQNTDELRIQDITMANNVEKDIPKVDFMKRGKTIRSIPETCVIKSEKDKMCSKPNVDFFGRTIEFSTTDVLTVNMKRESSVAVWYQFKEGHSNAVRKTIYIKNIL